MALPKDMNYSQRLRAMGTSASKANLTVAPNNGSSFTANTGMMQFEIPGQQLGTFADLSNAYIACDINNAAAGANDGLFTNVGSMAIVNRLVISTNTNKTICDITNKNMLDGVMLIKHADDNYLDSVGNALFGTNNSAVAGNTISAGTTQRYLIPLSLIGIDEVMFPLCGQEHLRIQIYLESAANTFICAADTLVTDAQLTFTSVLLHYDTVQLTNDEFSQLVNDFDGKFLLTVSCWQNQDSTLDKDATQISTTLGFSKRRAKRLIVTQRNVDNLAAPTRGAFAIDRALVTSASLKLNGREVKTQTYDVSNNGPEIYAEAIKSSGGKLLSMEGSNVSRAFLEVAQNAIPTIANGNNVVGRFFIEFDLQNGLEIDDSVISGLNIASGNFTLALTKSNVTTANRQMDVYMEYWNELELDMKGAQTWSIYN